jgi:16S rRNA (cytosine1402-N4)-methyltransferase
MVRNRALVSKKKRMRIAMIVHTPVLLNEALTLLDPGPDSCLFVDATLGEGGYSFEILSRFPSTRVIGIEIDASILAVAKERLAGFGDRMIFYNTWFNEFFVNFDKYSDQRPDRIIFDLGISRFHYEKAGRGFSFSKNEPLDMRLDPEAPESAGSIVNEASQQELAEIFFTFGEERFGRQIAAAIVRERQKKRIETSGELARIVEGAVPAKSRHSSRIHPATRVFQALRIATNRELENLREGIESAFRVLKIKGRMGVISYHSLEDRIVKHFFKEKNMDCTCPPDWPICKCGGKRSLDIVTKKPVTSGEAEISANRASRSAKLRVVEKVYEGDTE